MFRTLTSIVVISAAILFVGEQARAQTEYELAQTVQKRNLAMKGMLKSYFPLLAIKNGKSADLEKAAQSAESVKAGLVSALSLFPEGTAKGEAPGSRARPEIWSKPDEFAAAADQLVEVLDQLIVSANSGDVEAFKTQFAFVESACIGCHEFKPSGGGRFRFPR
jgi:cytochrome c556